MIESTCALVLAAGKGTRMHCDTKPKVMMNLLGEPILWYVYKALTPVLGDRLHTVVGFQAEVVGDTFEEHMDRMILQERQLGTGHALQVSWDSLTDQGYTHCLAINGDTPLITTETVERLLREAERENADLAFATIEPEEPNAFGRVTRDDEGNVSAIVEKKDFDPDEHGPEPREVNVGIYLLRMETIGPLLGWLSNANKSKEYYITDLVEFALADQLKVHAVRCGNDTSLMGVNSPAELVAAEERLRRRIVNEHLQAGVIVRNPDAVRIGPRVIVKPGVEITGPCEIVGETCIGTGARIEAFTSITETWISEGTHVRQYSHLDHAVIGHDCSVGPYTRLRPNAVLEDEAKVGNFVEMKKAVLGPGSKASHLTYLGDAEIGADVNIGAGTITCNYDGKNKHKTTIMDGAFIGSNTALVAPVTIGRNALVGAGSTISKDVDDGHLAVTRANMVHAKRRK
jgi:bifunctional UDP-N-acetylglucosamine pyrophosphorylase/glucosamine-1-phosphate N-acetyltransferase